jgi:release factor glutamine methyltransferase
VSQETCSIAQALDWARAQLTHHSDAQQPELAGIDSKVLLCSCLDCELVFLHTWPEKSLTDEQWLIYRGLVERRLKGHPVAHLVGYRYFWSLRLEVSTATLIPRPETETLVEIALSLPLEEQATVLDLGTGTGAIALALASEKPNWLITGIDSNEQAVQLARRNAGHNRLISVQFLHSDWFAALGSQQYDLIVTNPPYVELDSPYLREGDLRFEPNSALTSGADGLDDIRFIIAHSQQHLSNSGWLVIEHGFGQSQVIANLMASSHFVEVRVEADLNGLDRVTLGRYQV